MGRTPKARKIVLDAAEKLVCERGAASLTFEKLSAVSGVTRGGITYHFPTKQALLSGLVERGFQHWQTSVDKLKPRDACCDMLAETIGQLRYVGEKDEDHMRLVAALVAAGTHEPALLDPIRDYNRERLADRTWTDRELKLFLLELVSEGLFWQELFNMYELPENAKTRLIALVEDLAKTWGEEDQE